MARRRARLARPHRRRSGVRPPAPGASLVRPCVWRGIVPRRRVKSGGVFRPFRQQCSGRRLDGMERDRNGLEILDRSECLRLLAGSSVGRVAVSVGALPVILPVNFRLAEAPGRTCGRRVRGGSGRAVLAHRLERVRDGHCSRDQRRAAACERCRASAPALDAERCRSHHGDLARTRHRSPDHAHCVRGGLTR